MGHDIHQEIHGSGVAIAMDLFQASLGGGLIDELEAKSVENWGPKCCDKMVTVKNSKESFVFVCFCSIFLLFIIYLRSI